MKRAGGLWARITDYENLMIAAERAQAGKRYRPSVLEFNFNREHNLLRLRDELKSGEYRPGEFRLFEIREPKLRVIMAAPYRDRVVHHALCNVIEPIFDRSFSPSCYANRRGMGSHRALRRCIELARKQRFVLRADIEKYFPSIDREILKGLIRRRIKCPDTLRLCDLIIDHAPETGEAPARHYPGDDLLTPVERRRGLPIGNLTSQIWANVYLSEVDHALAKRFGGRNYLRYVDDLVVFANDADELGNARKLLEKLLSGLRLTAHPVKTFIAPTRTGVNWLGFRILPDRVRVRAENLKRAKRRIEQMKEAYASGRIGPKDLNASMRSWIAHLEHGDTWRLREKIFASLVFRRGEEGMDSAACCGAAIGTTIQRTAGRRIATTTRPRTRTTTTGSASPELPRVRTAGWESGGRA